MKELKGTIVEVIGGWDRLVAFRIQTDEGVVETEFFNPPTTPKVGQQALVAKRDGSEDFKLLNWWD